MKFTKMHGCGNDYIYINGFVETVRENLIVGSALGPVGSMEIGRHAAELPQVSCLHIGVVPLLKQPEAAIGGVDQKIVEI